MRVLSICLLLLICGCAAPQYHCVQQGHLEKGSPLRDEGKPYYFSAEWVGDGYDCYPMEGD